MTPDILLVAGGWRERSLMRAQLLEDGFDVYAIESSEEAELLLGSGAVRTRLILFEATTDPHPGAAIATFRRIVPEVPLLVLAGAGTLNAAERALVEPGHLVLRPFRVRDVVAAVRERIQRARGA